MTVARGVSVGRIIILALPVFLAVVCVLPFYYVLRVSLSDPLRVRMGAITILPRGFSLEACNMILRQATFFNAFKVTVARTATALSVQTMMGCALASRRLAERKRLMFQVVLTILLSGGTIPTCLVVRYTGILDTLLALIIPPAFNAFNIIILTRSFAGIPDSLEESTRIGGAHAFAVFSRMHLPLSLPALMTITLFVSVYRWNTLMDVILYVNKSTLRPLQVYLMDLTSGATATDMYEDPDEYTVPFLSIQTTAIVTDTADTSRLLVCPFIQKHFVKAVMIGPIRG